VSGDWLVALVVAVLAGSGMALVFWAVSTPR
jgi:hypothetical protein